MENENVTEDERSLKSKCCGMKGENKKIWEIKNKRCFCLIKKILNNKKQTAE